MVIMRGYSAVMVRVIAWGLVMVIPKTNMRVSKNISWFML